jgi:hypothetical protein
MTEILVQNFFGWPAIITSILLSIAGVLLKKPALSVAAGIVYTFHVLHQRRIAYTCLIITVLSDWFRVCD